MKVIDQKIASDVLVVGVRQITSRAHQALFRIALEEGGRRPSCALASLPLAGALFNPVVEDR